MYKPIIFRILAGLVLLAAIVGIAALAFNAGMARGSALDLANTGELPESFGRYGLPFYGHPLLFAPWGLLSCLVPLFLLFLAFGALRSLIWGRRMLHGCGPWHGEGMPPRFAEWHRRAHEKAPETPASE